MNIFVHIASRFLKICICISLCMTISSFVDAQVSPFDQKHKLSKEELSSSKVEEAPVLAPISEPAVAIESVVALPSEEVPNDETTTSGIVEAMPEASDSEDDVENEDSTTMVAGSPEIDKGKDSSSSIVTNVAKRAKNQPLFLFLMLIAATILTTLTISSNKSLVNNILRAVLNDNYLNLMYREQKKTGTFHYYILYFVFAVNAGLFLYFLLSRVIFNDGVPLLWQCVFLIGLVYVCRHLFMTYMAHVYSFHKEVEQYAFTILIFNIFLGLLLLPINVFVAFSPEPIGSFFLYIGLTIVLIVYVFRQLRGIFISSRLLINNKFYFLLYICAVEIAPVLLLVKYSGAYVS